MNTQYFNPVRSKRLIHLSIGTIICCFFLCLCKDKIVGNDFKHRHLRTMVRREKYKEMFKIVANDFIFIQTKKKTADYGAYR